MGTCEVCGEHNSGMCRCDRLAEAQNDRDNVMSEISEKLDTIIELLKKE